MAEQKIRVEKDRETYLATLYGKALDARAERPILGDTMAAEAVARLDVDFGALNLPQGGEVTLPLRARHFDDWTRRFLARNPGGSVLNLGCGLDTRVYRVAPPPGVAWLDVDFPDVVALRRRLYPERPGYHLVGASATDPGWLAEVPADRPALVVAEGLMMYLPEDEGGALLRRVVARFPSGEVCFDAYSARMVRLVSRLATVRGAQVELVWGVDDPRDLERLAPGLRLAEEVPFLTMPGLLDRQARGPLSRAALVALAAAPFYRGLVRHLRYEFGAAEEWGDRA